MCENYISILFKNKTSKKSLQRNSTSFNKLNQLGGRHVKSIFFDLFLRLTFLNRLYIHFFFFHNRNFFMSCDKTRHTYRDEVYWTKSGPFFPHDFGIRPAITAPQTQFFLLRLAFFHRHKISDNSFRTKNHHLRKFTRYAHTCISHASWFVKPDTYETFSPATNHPDETCVIIFLHYVAPQTRFQ